MPVLPPAVADVLAGTRALANSAAGAATGGPVTAEERAGWLAGLRLVIDAAEAAFTTVLADFDTDGDGQVLHAAASTQSWLRGALGMAAGEAAERVRIARTTSNLLAAPVAALLAEPTTATAADSDGAGTVTCRMSTSARSPAPPGPCHRQPGPTVSTS